MIYHFISAFGILCLTGVAWLFSRNRKKISWKTVGWGVALQLLFALFVFRIPAGTKLFSVLNDIVIKVIEASTAGSQFVFGMLALPPGVKGSPGFIFAFQALPTIIFFSALISLLYFFRVMPLLIRGFASLFSRVLVLSGAESLSAASNIFVGIESSFTVQPHLSKMTASELCTVLTAGMATVASNVLALYVFTLREQFPGIAGHLISASILSAPAAIVMSKLLLPEEGTPETFGKRVAIHYERPSNFFEAVINGANNGVKVIVGVAALLIAVLGLIALADMLLGVVGGWVNSIFSLELSWSLKTILGMLFYPFTLALGVPPEDAGTVAKIIGERTLATEVAGYQSLAAAIAGKNIIHPRSVIITTYALCGFAHFASMAIFIGGIAALAPGQKNVLSTVGFRALCAATLACLMTACTAGIFAGDASLLTGF